MTINQRQSDDQKELREWLRKIGNGEQTRERIGRVENWIDVDEELIASTLDEIIDFCFTPELFADPIANAHTIAENAILCPTNLDVQQINELAIGRINAPTGVYTSIDEPLDQEEYNGEHRADFNMETINNEMPSGMPPHKLTLKVNLFCLFYSAF